MTKFSDIKKRWLRNPEVRTEYDALEEEFALARELILARSRAGLSQAEVARRMGTTQSTVARLEGGRTKPTLLTVERYAKATGSRAVVKLVPDKDAA
ncbi:MAG: helix-turn-helix transcriptional regulator [Immundisolibacter sp.]|jgi:transcriptional regulator with XRE-family HTH domain|uniref:helix-turn-helix domain-containing protein n=1 Tax=Immundisolibacter sp. TaxID=1934948 RepID=UPI0019868431|nr:helix-turn-helix transcriptional regulator [Immundisolibacter sp.]MBC7162929.1 helix-turn-helix transcriptional regulator [Immundisolibacter sp.]